MVGASIPAYSRPAAGPHERHEDAVAIRPFVPVVAAPGHDDEPLPIARPDRDDQPTAVRQLVEQRGRDGRGRRCHHDPVEGSVGRGTEAAVSHPDLDPIDQPERLEPGGAAAARSGNRSIDSTRAPSVARIAAW